MTSIIPNTYARGMRGSRSAPEVGIAFEGGRHRCIDDCQAICRQFPVVYDERTLCWRIDRGERYAWRIVQPYRCWQDRRFRFR